MPSDAVTQIKEKLSVVDVIGSYIKLQKAGVNFKARCPFHNEKTPSFHVTPERQIWHCFGCGKGGDIFAFVEEIEGVEFKEALRILAQRAGVELEAFSPQRGAEAKAEADERTRLLTITENATRFYEKQLFHSEMGKKALAYLLDRGLTEDTIKEFRLGFAPNDWRALAGFLRDRNHGEQDIIAAGLAIKKENGRDAYDRFRSRIMFPIADLHGQVVDFTGRVFDPPGVDPNPDAGGKYINTPQTSIYDKSRILYGLDKAKADVRRADRCLLVEGNMDAIMSWQAGVKGVVASSGTALTPNHLKLLQRFTTNLDFCFDTDQAGTVATRRGIALALQQQFNINVVTLDDPQCKDPADYVVKHGTKWTTVASAAKPVIQYYFDTAKAEYDPGSAESKRKVMMSVAPFIKRLTSQVEKAHWISQLAFFMRLKEEAVQADLATVKDDLLEYDGRDGGGDDMRAPGAGVSAAISQAMAASATLPEDEKPDILGEALLSMVVHKPDLLTGDQAEITAHVETPFLREALAKIIAQAASFNFDKFVKEFDRDKALRLEFIHLKSQELWHDFNDKELAQEFSMLCSKISKRAIHARLASLEADIKQAEAARDSDRLKALLTEFSALTQDLAKIHSA